VSWSLDGQRVTAGLNGILSVWDVRTRNKIAFFRGNDPRAVLDGSEQVRFLPDGRSVLINQPGGPAVIDYEHAEILQRLSVQESGGGGFAASADGRTVVVAEKRCPTALFSESGGGMALGCVE
jgi:hypothetical protein